MIQAAICDDEPHTRAYLASLLRKQPYPCKIAQYDSAETYWASGQTADLLLLDIQLKDGAAGGLDLARRLRRTDLERQPVVIFVTGHDRYVFDAFDVGAFQYLLKPIDEEKFAQVCRRAMEEIAGRGKRCLTVQSAGLMRRIPLEKIRCAESRNHQVTLWLPGEEVTYYARIRDLEQTLGEEFFRIHKGYLVNLAWVESYGKTALTLEGGGTLPISKYKYPEFVRAYLRFLKGRLSHE